MSQIAVIVVAAGKGKRFGAAKQFVELRGRPVLDWCLEKFEEHEAVDEIVLVLSEEEFKDKYIQKYKKITSFAPGGRRRQDSVYSGLTHIKSQEPAIVLVHDGVRPLINRALINRVIEGAKEKGAVVPVIPVEDTVKIVKGQRIFRTEDRKNFFRSQTPQGFSFSLLKEAFGLAKKERFLGTDEAALVEKLGRDVFAIEGDSRNIKITTPDDLKIAEALLED
jgi:2-C-methyl-D-erythritol 4-phosphate cytidylyltransferase